MSSNHRARRLAIATNTALEHLQESARDYLQRGWQPMRLKPRSKKPPDTHDSWHYFFNAPGCEAFKFRLPEGFDYPRALPVHNGKPSRTVLEIRGGDGTYTMVPPSMHPDGEAIEWNGSRRDPVSTTAKDLRTLAGRHAYLAMCQTAPNRRNPTANIVDVGAWNRWAGLAEASTCQALSHQDQVPPRCGSPDRLPETGFQGRTGAADSELRPGGTLCPGPDDLERPTLQGRPFIYTKHVAGSGSCWHEPVRHSEALSAFATPWPALPLWRR